MQPIFCITWLKEHKSSKKYAIPANTQARAYISFLNINGVSLIQISLITPPPAPVTVPIIIAITDEQPQSKAFVSPISVNIPSPIVSNKNIVLL